MKVRKRYGMIISKVALIFGERKGLWWGSVLEIEREPMKKKRQRDREPRNQKG